MIIVIKILPLLLAAPLLLLLACCHCYHHDWFIRLWQSGQNFLFLSRPAGNPSVSRSQYITAGLTPCPAWGGVKAQSKHPSSYETLTRCSSSTNYPPGVEQGEIMVLQSGLWSVGGWWYFTEVAEGGGVPGRKAGWCHHPVLGWPYPCPIGGTLGRRIDTPPPSEGKSYTVPIFTRMDTSWSLG